MNKVDFIMTFTVENANGNGDPLAENRPRVDSNGLGEVSDVCLKRKIRNRLQDNKNAIFVQSKEDIFYDKSYHRHGIQDL